MKGSPCFGDPEMFTTKNFAVAAVIAGLAFVAFLGTGTEAKAEKQIVNRTAQVDKLVEAAVSGNQP